MGRNNPRPEFADAFSEVMKSKRARNGSRTDNRFFVDPNYPHVIVDGGKDFGGLQCAEEDALEYCALLNAAVTPLTTVPEQS